MTGLAFEPEAWRAVQVCPGQGEASGSSGHLGARMPRRHLDAPGPGRAVGRLTAGVLRD